MTPTYDENERSPHGAKPLQCFQFYQGENFWRNTNADRPITLPFATFDPTDPISAESLKLSREGGEESIVVRVPPDHPVLELFKTDLRSTPVGITIFQAFRGDEADFRAVFTGRVVQPIMEGSEGGLVCQSVAAYLNRQFPPLVAQTPCNLVTFSAECGADPLTHQDTVTITTVNGVEITSADFALRPDGWFTGGVLVKPEGGVEERFIVEHVGDVIRLFSPMPGLESLDVCYARWGDDHLEATCRDKFGRLQSHDGLSRAPRRNPFAEGVG